MVGTQTPPPTHTLESLQGQHVGILWGSGANAPPREDHTCGQMPAALHGRST